MTINVCHMTGIRVPKILTVMISSKTFTLWVTGEHTAGTTIQTDIFLKQNSLDYAILTTVMAIK